MAKSTNRLRRLLKWFGDQVTDESTAAKDLSQLRRSERPDAEAEREAARSALLEQIGAGDLLQGLPSWLLRPLPANATIDESLEAEIDKFCQRLPELQFRVSRQLRRVESLAVFESAANRASAWLWKQLPFILRHGSEYERASLVQETWFLAPRAHHRLLRRLAKDPSLLVRRTVSRRLAKSPVREVSIANRATSEDWSPTQWTTGSEVGRLYGHETGQVVLRRHDLPELRNVRQLRELLGIKSRRQLGYLLVASDRNGGPYHRFQVPKRDGAARDICAPGETLCWVQRQILQKILSKVPAHPAAHGFVPGRSTVTNAEPHVKADLVLKFDLRDFFPTIHFFRVVGLFASLGYHLQAARFSASDRSSQLAATLARLCCYADDPSLFGGGFLPQGAPTSPAISNLICRRMDARLHGLAESHGGAYTRYADDLTFSFRANHELPQVGRFRWWVDQICHQEGFLVNQAKFRAIRASQRQQITGIVVNDRPQIPRPLRRKVRAILHNCRKTGVALQLQENPGLKSYLTGWAAYVQMVQPEEGRRLFAEINELFGSD